MESSNQLTVAYSPQEEVHTPAPADNSLPLILIAGLILPAFLAYALVVTSEAQVLAVVLALLGVAVILARPSWGLVLFVGLIYIRPEETFPSLAGMRLTLAISVVTLIGVYLQIVVNRERFVRSRVNLLLAGFTSWVVVSVLGRSDVSETVEIIVKAVIMVPLALNLIRTRDTYRGLVTALICFTAYLAIYSIYLYFTGGAFQRGEFDQSKATGIFGDPNDLSASIIPGVALSLTRARQTSPLGRAVYWALCGAMIWAIYLTNSRGGMLALLVLASAYIFSFQRNKFLALALASVVAVGILVGGPGRMSQLDTGEASANSRFWFWSNAVSELARDPLRGVGHNLFAEVNGGKVAHNTFVQCFVEVGLPGYFCWIGCLYYCFRRRPRGDQAEEPTEQDRTELLGARLALVGYLAACFWITRTTVPITYLILSLPLACMVACGGKPLLFSLTRSESIQDMKRIAAIALGSIVVIHIMAISLR